MRFEIIKSFRLFGIIFSGLVLYLEKILLLPLYQGIRKASPYTPIPLRGEAFRGTGYYPYTPIPLRGEAFRGTGYYPEGILPLRGEASTPSGYRGKALPEEASPGTGRAFPGTRRSFSYPFKKLFVSLGIGVKSSTPSG